MNKLIYFSFVLLRFVTFVFNDEDKSFHECVENNEAEGACKKITKIDYAIIIDDSVFQETESAKANEYRQNYTTYYENLLKSVVGHSNFNYSAENVRRAVIITTSYGGYKRQEFDDYNKGNNVVDRNYYGLFPAVKSPLPQVLDVLKVASEDGGRKNVQKIVLVVTRGIVNKNEGKKFRQRLKNMVKENIFLFFFVYMYKEATKNLRSEVFPSDQQLTNGSDQWNGTHLTFVNIGSDDAQEKGQSVADCMCSKVGDCQYRMHVTGCRFYFSNGTEQCAETHAHEILHYGTNQTNVTCPDTKNLPCDNEQCVADCDLKGWVDWVPSDCPCGVQTRKRIDESAGLSEFTSKCKETDSQTCTAKYDCYNKTTTGTTMIQRSAIKPTKNTPPKTVIQYQHRKDIEEGEKKESNLNLNTWLIIGGCIGGMFFFSVIILITVVVVKKKKRRDVQNVVIDECRRKRKPRRFFRRKEKEMAAHAVSSSQTTTI